MSSTLFLSLLCLFASVARSEKEEKPCRLWLAPSHVSSPEKIKFGLFAGVDYAENETIPSSEIAIPLVDFLEKQNRDTPLNAEIMEYLEPFVWTAEYAGARFEGNYSSTALIPGIGVLANYHTGISNIDWVEGAAFLRDREDITEPGKAHPSRGAITPYSNLTVRATRVIRSGMELFANFGEVWDESKVDVYQDTLTRWNYEEADKVLDKIIEFMDKYDDQMDDKLKDDVLDFMLKTVLAQAAGKRGKLIKSLIPDHPGKLKRVKEAGGTFHYRYPDMIKSQKWLEKHGFCVDNIRTQKSTIPDAGRGAFANRDIKKEKVISPVPTVAIANKELMNMYQIVASKGEDDQLQLSYDRTKPIGQQLLLNYVIGHPQSSLLLVPVAPMVSFVNHAPVGQGANAYLTWSKHDHIFNDHRLHDFSVSEIEDQESPIITFNLVALDDIKEGDEIFIDYGPEWIKAWEDYKAQWSQKYADGKWPLKAEDIQLTFKDKPYPVDIKQDSNPYPPNVATAAFIKSDEVDDGQPRRNSRGMEILKWIGPVTFDDYTGHQMFICDLLARHEDGQGSYNYTAITRFKEDTEIVQVDNIPHVAIKMVDRPYQGDIHTPGAFRHPISIGDNRWPQAWRDLRE